MGAKGTSLKGHAFSVGHAGRPSYLFVPINNQPFCRALPRVTFLAEPHDGLSFESIIVTRHGITKSTSQPRAAGIRREGLHGLTRL